MIALQAKKQENLYFLINYFKLLLTLFNEYDNISKSLKQRQTLFGSLAQLVEHLTFNQGVWSSNLQ